MRELLKRRKELFKQSGQGMTEYILLLVIIIAVAAIFRKPITDAIREKMGTVSKDIQGFSVETN